MVGNVEASHVNIRRALKIEYLGDGVTTVDMRLGGIRSATGEVGTQDFRVSARGAIGRWGRARSVGVAIHTQKAVGIRTGRSSAADAAVVWAIDDIGISSGANPTPPRKGRSKRVGSVCPKVTYIAESTVLIDAAARVGCVVLSVALTACLVRRIASSAVWSN